MKTLYNWLGKHVHAPYGAYVFGLLVIIEGFFVVPVSTMLAFFCLEKRQHALWYAALATATSAIGALIGYALGALVWKTLGPTITSWLVSPDKFEYLVQQFEQHQAWAITGIALTPMPFKALTLTAGFCKLPIIPFVFFTLLGRGIRFFAIAVGIYIWGEKIQYYLNKYFYYIIALGIAFFILLWRLLH
jgi:membrane protein YqaA with SNARE-associated domain